MVRGVLTCTSQRRASAPTLQMGLFQQPAVDPQSESDHGADHGLVDRWSGIGVASHSFGGSPDPRPEGDRVTTISKNCWRRGMSTSEPRAGERVKDVRLSEDAISVDLVDGRTISAPLAWYPRLLHATPQQRMNWKIAGAGATAFTGRNLTRT
jgi:hypothetical protein